MHPSPNALQFIRDHRQTGKRKTLAARLFLCFLARGRVLLLRSLFKTNASLRDASVVCVVLMATQRQHLVGGKFASAFLIQATMHPRR